MFRPDLSTYQLLQLSAQTVFLSLPNLAFFQDAFMSSTELQKKTFPIRKKIIANRRAGVSFPLLSLLTKESLEGGDFHTLELMAQWGRQTGVSIIQILPLNDLGFGRSPYSSISAFAIDPLYISLYTLGINIRSRKEKIITLDVNMSRVRELKVQNLRIIFRRKND